VSASPLSINSERDVKGSTTPRLWTPPLRDLGEPGATLGPLVNDFARDILVHPLDPWQEWLTTHALELLPDGRPRFRIVLVLVSRQNGKTEVPVVLTLYWTFVEGKRLILGTSTKIDYAKESWMKAVELAERAPGLRGLVPAKRRSWIRQANGEQEWNINQSRYKIAAANEEGGRSLTIDALVMDELRQHHTRAAWAAAIPAMTARPDAQAWCLSNAGSDKSVVLNEEREAALHFINTGEGDPRVGLFEWSAPEGSDPEDLDALIMSNPNLGHRIMAEDLLGQAKTAKRLGGEALATFLTENMCIRVSHMKSAVDPDFWQKSLSEGTLEKHRDTLAACIDLSPDELHATLAIAALTDNDTVRVEIVHAWDGHTAAKDARTQLPALIKKIKPRTLVWFPGGPAASLAADLRKKGATWPPSGVTVEEIKSDAPGVCMELASLVTSGQVMHAPDPLLDAHVLGAEKLNIGDKWAFSRRNGGHVDAAYAAAGAIHAARSLPPRRKARMPKGLRSRREAAP
jgi:hypothetical protein